MLGFKFPAVGDCKFQCSSDHFVLNRERAARRDVSNDNAPSIDFLNLGKLRLRVSSNRLSCFGLRYHHSKLPVKRVGFDWAAVAASAILPIALSTWALDPLS